MHQTSSLLILAFALTPAIVAAAETVQLPAFQQLELRGGGEVVVRHGGRQQVNLLSGSSRISRFEVDRQGRLIVRACETQCPRDYKLRIEIVSPRLDALAVTGGGTVRAAAAFPGRQNLALAVTGGGVLDARAMPARSVAAAVTGGGLINTAPSASMTAAVRGGGSIRYWGNPSVTQAVVGGGAVTRAGA
jgi:hypothetical protein